MQREEPGARRLKLEAKMGEESKIEREELIKSEGKVKTGLQKLRGKGKRAVSIALALSIVGTGLAQEPILHNETRLINTQKVERVYERPTPELQKRAKILWTVKAWKENASEKTAQDKQSQEESPHTHIEPMNKILKAIKPKKETTNE